jgi:hypothetical protein
MGPQPKIVVYTAQVGGLDEPRDDIICFTNNNGFKESRRAARMYKVLAHRFVDADYSIWVDNLVFLNQKPEDLLKLLNGKDIAVMRHPTNESIFEEADDVINSKLEEKNIVDSQMLYYRKKKYNPEDGLAMTCLLIRKHTKKVEELNNAWWAEISSGSKRDQLSFNYVFDGHISYIDWPEDQNKDFNNDYWSRGKHKKSLIYKIKSLIRLRTRLKILKEFFK